MSLAEEAKIGDPPTAAAGGAEAPAESELETYRRAFKAIQHVLNHAGKGDLEARVLHTYSFGPLGGTLDHINDLLDLTDAFVRESSATLDAASHGHYYRRFFSEGMRGSFGKGADIIDAARHKMQRMEDRLKEERNRLADRFEERMEHVSKNIAKSIGVLGDVAEDLSGVARQSLDKSVALGSESHNTRDTISNIASAAEQLSYSVSEISDRIANAQKVSAKAAAASRTASATIAELDHNVQKIEEVVRLIHEIASQTNLLALNATIEAARAGEAGKGFAVVAGEVKNLSAQTATATNAISETVKQISTSMKAVVQHNSDVSEANAQLDDLTMQIAHSTEEQRLATAEISSNMQSASGSAQILDKTAKEVRDASQSVGDSASSVSDTVRILSTESETLRKAISDYLAYLRRNEMGAA